MTCKRLKNLLPLAFFLLGSLAPVYAETLDAYRSDLERRISRACFPPRMTESKRTVIDLQIGKNGQLVGQRLSRSSGTSGFDRSCQKAIENSAPFRPLSSSVKGPLCLQMTFDETDNKILCSSRFSDSLSVQSNHYPQIDMSGNPQTAKEYLARADMRNMRGDYKGAFEDLSHVMQLDPNNYQALMLRGVTRAQQKDYSGAIDDFSKMIKLQPTLKEAYFYRSGVKIQMGDTKSASEDMEKYWQLGGTYGKQ